MVAQSRGNQREVSSPIQSSRAPGTRADRVDPAMRSPKYDPRERQRRVRPPGRRGADVALVLCVLSGVMRASFCRRPSPGSSRAESPG